MTIIDDEDLISWFQENFKEIKFIVFKPDYERICRSSNLTASIGELRSEKKLFEQKDTLIKIWKDLVANAIIFLKSKDKREHFHDDGDYGIEDLGKFYESYCKFENLLYGSGEYYRDHVSHVFKVFLLGEYLVRKNLGDFSSIEVMDDKLEEYSKVTGESEADNNKVSNDEKEAMWCLASLTHDLGYPTEVVHEIHDKLRDMLSVFNVQDTSFILSQQSQMFNDYILRLISSDLEFCKDQKKYTTHTQAKYYFKYSRSIENWDHGVESCIVLVKSLVYFLETDFSLDRRRLMNFQDARQFLIKQRILRAIASHNCDFIYHLKLDLSFLLRIIDEMQEWDRPRLTDLFIKPPQIQFQINDFQKKKVNYLIKFSYNVKINDEDLKDLHRNVKEFFRRKINKYIMILRSAVGGEQRCDDQFVLTFNVEDTISNKKNKYKYKFIHKTPENISFLLNDTKIDLSDLDNDKWGDFYTKHFDND